MQRHYVAPLCLTAALVTLFACRIETASSDTFRAKDPGVRATVPGNPNPGNPLPDLTKNQQKFFDVSKADFEEEETVSEGLGPTMNLDSCGGCHAQPAVGGTSPATNPQVVFATTIGNRAPSFIRPDGPVREARFKENADGSPDGGVHALFTVAGLMQSCHLRQPDFDAALSANNVIFRIPTPVFGLGLIEQIPDSALLANQAANATAKRTLGIRAGRTSFSPAVPFPVSRTSTAMTGPSPASAGRPRTNRSSYSRPRPTTSRWGSPTGCFRRNAMRRRDVRLRRHRTT